MIELADIALLLMVGLVGSYFWQAHGIREIALRATRVYCQREGLQLLDESIALRTLWLKRDPKGKVRVWRGYQFEFTATGDERYVGKTVTLGKFVESIQVPVHRVPEDERTLH